ncbi:MAG: 3-oxoacyl-[acyl-carrier-protein] synthase III C-terminal domain-containing protein [Alteromonas macleodii]|uniref:3-oxoacyl-[acyl-carrier-protein] synthase III C-terminal domain-containing protein n=1 Tax=Alteromonas TaxID=226 RepID=UPI001E2F2FC7|nr:3-oxoacyl-[acyl-carrier-protein] synthase III C-terminal domain-containing protein [Alteromonas macleodii]MDM7960708.1 3-oxoacyl-[acyl-carrier-protein] synthase III C-terminal domain-containing protein [Alteromonas macleodii]MDM8169445.1 3-oxoacyl-[acyl-carrier-protein] synthase III C-terminal domain-containing protein [Alteromonas macleodii]
MAIVNAIARRFKGCENKLIKALEDMGNTASVSVPLILENCLNSDNRTRLVLSGFCVGFKRPTSLLKRN